MEPQRAAVQKLSQGKGNLVRQAEMLRELGVAPSKRVPANLLETGSQDDPETALPQAPG